jgi:alanyl-tRNA synthetase
MNASEIRRRFLDYFVAQAHQEVASSTLIPADDPTLLFTNAGMVQFKRAFLGQERRDYRRAVTCQKCVRAGGKHNDLEQVGLTRRHHTFFEMLGNFSFGDYFKKEAIAYAWEFVTSSAYLGLAPERLRFTVHHTDAEARELWIRQSGLPVSFVYELGDRDNFWQMGDTGPCGPCSEIYVDLEWRPGARRREYSKEEFEGLAESGRFLEIWNLVFMQFDRSADGVLTPLPAPSVDTGAGLERIASVLQKVDDNFHIDLFVPLLDRVAELVGASYPGTMEGTGASYRVLADHARAVAFLLADGLYPSNEGRGYVLRRILRRAVRHAWLLGRRQPTLAPLTDVVIETMGESYPELVVKRETIRAVTSEEEGRFLETIEGGLGRLDELFASGVRAVSGEEAFKLYDTYGFPIDLTQLIARERGVEVDLAQFEAALEEQRERSRAAASRGVGTAGGGEASDDDESWTVLRDESQVFVGYQDLEADTDVLAFRAAGDRVELVLRDNPFYLESGGQVSDTGHLEGAGWRIAVDRVRKGARGTVVSGAWAGVGRFEPTPLRAVVDRARRRNIERNHSATHVAHWALRKHLGAHVRQQGSLVAPERLRFDFSHHGPIDPGLLAQIEQEINEAVWANYPVETRVLPLPEALALGAMAFFADKYGDRVRVVAMGPSLELCGGTHVGSTGALGLFRFAGQSGVAAGVRRIEAVTGPAAYGEVETLRRRLATVGQLLKANPDQLTRKVEQLLEERTKLEDRLAAAAERGGEAAGRPMGTVHEINGHRVTVAETELEDNAEIAAAADRFRSGARQEVLVMIASRGKGAIHVALSDDLVQRGKRAGDLVNRLAAVSGGKGGGRPTFASASAGDPAKLGAVTSSVSGIVSAWLAS